MNKNTNASFSTSIKESNFEFYFQRSMSDLFNDNSSFKIGDLTYEEYKKQHNKQLNSQDLKADAFLAYYKLLDNIHCVNDSTEYEQENFKKTTYYDNVGEKIINELLGKPIFHIILLSYLLNESLIRNVFHKIHLKEKLKEEEQKRLTTNAVLIKNKNSEVFDECVLFLQGQLDVVDEIMSGISELVKNIVEHSEKKEGTITIKTTTESNLDKENKINKHLWNNYFAFANNQPGKKKYLEISITDVGTIGVIETSLQNMKSNFRSIDENIRTHDIEILEREINNCQKGNSKESELLFNLYFEGNNPLKLDRQANNCYKGLGINLFTEFINRNHGLFNVQTNTYGSRNETIDFSYFNKSLGEKIVDPRFHGTTYKIILPIKAKNREQSKEKGKIPQLKEPLTKVVYEKMLPLKTENGDHINLSELKAYNLAKYVIKDFITLRDEIFVLSLNSKEINRLPIRIDKSTLYRSVYDFLKNNTISTIVINDVPQETIAGLFKMYAAFSKDGTDFFPEGKMMLLFTKDKRKRKYREGVIITGKTEAECKEINKCASESRSYFRVAFGDYLSQDGVNDDRKETINKKLNSHILFSSGQLIKLDYFNPEYSYFNPIKHNLQRSIDLKKTIGYDWKHTHLKISSKLHLDDFVYGKKMFQRSGEASDFAFSVARDIYEYISEKYKKNITENPPKTFFTLVGYGYYSELLVSKICDFSNKLIEYRYGNKEEGKPIRFEYIIVKDEDKIKFSRYIHNLEMRETKDTCEKMIIIVPISSTLTTCLKIENEFYKVIESNRKKSSEIYNESRGFNVEPLFYTPVVVGHDVDLCALEGDIEKYKEVNMVWDDVDAKKKIIITENREVKNRKGEEDAKRDNKFNVYLKSKWRLPKDCEHCFPTIPIRERPLFITDKVSVTPSLIFDHPKWYKFDETSCINEPYFYLKKETSSTSENVRPNTPLPIIDKIDWVHYTSDNNKHFNYYLHYLDFFNANKLQLKRWTEEIRNRFSAERDGKVLLIAPDKSENGAFIHFINREVFEDRAEIIRFDKHSDHYLNFDKFFRDKIRSAKAIYFVDNLMLSGETFLTIDEILKVSQNRKRIKRIKGVLCLINRMDYSCCKTVIGKLNENNKSTVNSFHSFVNLNVPESVLTPCPLCDEKKKYEDLKNNVSLGCIKQYFIEKEMPYFKEVDKINLMENKLPHLSLIKKQNSNLLKVALIHFLNKALSEYSENNAKAFIDHLMINKLPTWVDSAKNEKIDYQKYLNFNGFCEDFRSYIKNQNQSNINDRDIVNDFKFKSNLIKILSSHSFRKHRGIYVSVFYWVLGELISATTAILGKDCKDLDGIENELSDFSVLSALNNDFSEEDRIDSFIDTVNYLRLLIKIGSTLNIAYLLHINFLRAINELINRKGKIIRQIVTGYSGLKASEVEKLKRKYIEMRYSFQNFKLFCAAHIIRSLHKNEQRGIRFERNLNELYGTCSETKNCTFLELLILENTGIIRQTLDSVKDVSELNQDDIFLNPFWDFCNNENIDENFDKINAAHQLHYTLVTYKVGKTPYSVYKENEEQNIVENIAKIIGCSKEGGGLLLYKYQDTSNKAENKAENYQVIGKYGSDATLVECLGNNTLPKSFTTTFLKGIDYLTELNSKGIATKYKWTNFAIHKNDDAWVGQEKIHIDKEYSEYEDIRSIDKIANRILFIRVASYHPCENKHNNEHEGELEGEAVFVFYDNENNGTKPDSIYDTRFVHVFRNEIGKYLKLKYKNDAFKAWVESERKRKDMLSFEHHYYHNVKDFYNCAIGNPNPEKLKFHYSQVHDARIIKSFMENGDISILDDIGELKVEDQITEYCDFNLEPEVRKITTIKIPNNLTIKFSEMLFRTLICEYLKNLNEALCNFTTCFGIDPTATIIVQSDNNEIKISLENNFILGENEKQNMIKIKEGGHSLYSTSNGLNTNKIILSKINSTPNIEMETTEHEAIGKFTIQFNIKKLV